MNQRGDVPHGKTLLHGRTLLHVAGAELELFPVLGGKLHEKRHDALAVHAPGSADRKQNGLVGLLDFRGKVFVIDHCCGHVVIHDSSLKNKFENGF